MARYNLFLIFGLLVFTGSVHSQTSQLTWKHLDDGLSLAEYMSPKKSEIGDNIISILKIDPEHYNFNLFSAKEKGEERHTVDEWAKIKNQVAVINAGMYRADHATNLGFMKDFDFANNASISKDNTILAFNRKDTSVPEIQIIDCTCQDWDELKEHYNSFSQSIRMVDCKQSNRWSQQNKKWSMVAIGIDKNGDALFIFSRSPYTVHDFISTLLEAPIHLYNLMYLEGGPEASLYVNHKGTELSKMGSYETGFMENDENNNFWRIPNVIGISKK